MKLTMTHLGKIHEKKISNSLGESSQEIIVNIVRPELTLSKATH